MKAIDNVRRRTAAQLIASGRDDDDQVPVDTTTDLEEILIAEVERLQGVCAEAYQFAGAVGAPERVLDNLHAAAEGRDLPHATMLPVSIEECDSLPSHSILPVAVEDVDPDRRPSPDVIRVRLPKDDERS